MVRRTPLLGDEMARKEEIRDSIGSNNCYRCGLDTSKFHSSRFVCRCFTMPSHLGRWLLWDDIRKTLAQHASRHTFSWWYAGRIEDPVEAYDHWHSVVGVAIDGHYAGRFEAPQMPEFSFIEWDTRADVLPEASMLTAPQHTFIYMGWRGQLRQFCRRARINPNSVARDLGVSPDRTGEDMARYETGWL